MTDAVDGNSSEDEEEYPDAPGMHNDPLLNHSKNSKSNARKYARTKLSSLQERLSVNFTSTCFSFVLLSAAVVVLFWNEWRIVKISRSVEEGMALVVPLSTTQVAFDENDNQLVHLMGTLRTEKFLEDAEYGVRVEAVKLMREAEMYQWIETTSERAINEAVEPRVETVYSYDKEWVSEIIDSEDFEENDLHRNPVVMPAESNTYIADKVYVGSFLLSENLISKIDKEMKYKLYSLPEGLPNAHILDGYIYQGPDPSNPQIGDVRIRFSYSGVCGKEYSKVYSDLGPPQQVSVIAKQVDSELEGYETYSGEIIEFLEFGRLSAEEMFSKEENANLAMTWSLRIVGFLMVLTSIILMHHVLQVIVSWIPIIRELAKLSTPTFVIGISVSLTLHTVGLAWVVQRPLWTLVLIVPTLIPLLMALQKKGYKRTPTKV